MSHLQSPKTNIHQIAKQLLNDSRFDEAKEILTELLEEDPSDFLAMHMLGLLAKKQSNGTSQ